MINKHKSNKIKENSNTVRHLNNGTDHRHSKSCCDQSSPARRTIMNYDEPYPENERGMNEFNAFDYNFDLFFNTWCQISNMLMVCWKCVKRAFLNDYFLRCSRDTTCWQFRSPVRENRESSWLILTLSSLLTPEVVITTTSGVASDEKVDIMMILFV